MNRRTVLAALLALIAAPAGAGPPAGKTAQIGMLSALAADQDLCRDMVRKGLGELGYTEGQSYQLDARYADGNADRLPELVTELVKRRVDLIVVMSATAVEAASQATNSIPIVMASSFYAKEMGFIASLAHPGGNLTGLTHFTPELMKKRVQLLKEAAPDARRVAVLRLPGRLHDLVVADMSAAGSQLGVEVQGIEVAHSEDIIPALEGAVGGGAQAVITTQSPFFFVNAGPIWQFALRHRLASISGETNAVPAGALLFYGPNVWDGCARVAGYVDRVLNGAKPADLPVEQPTKIRFIINLKTAKALDLVIPQALFARADEVIE